MYTRIDVILTQIENELHKWLSDGFIDNRRYTEYVETLKQFGVEGSIPSIPFHLSSVTNKSK